MKPIVFATLLLAQAASSAADQAPNILWVITDDQRMDSINAFNRMTRNEDHSKLGEVMSPNVDRLAAMGTTFINTFNQNPGCAPSRTSMHTGRYSHRSGVYGFEYYDPSGMEHWRPMIPQVLPQDASYQTLSVGKKGIRHRGLPNDRQPGALYQVDLGYRNEFEAKGQLDWNKTMVWKTQETTEKFYFPDGTVLSWPQTEDGDALDRDEIQERLDLLRHHLADGSGKISGSILGGVNPQPGDKTRDGSFTSALSTHLANADKKYTNSLDAKLSGPDTSKPIFVHLGYDVPHTPVLPPAEFREKFSKLTYKVPELTDQERNSFPPQIQKLLKNSASYHFSDEEKQQMIADYFAFCAYGDALVGQAVDDFIAFSEKHARPWMVLYVCGDHGWRLNEHGMVSKFGHFDIDLHNPIIAVSSDKKKFPAGKVVTDFTQFVDMAPTIYTAAGLDVSKPKYDYLDGRDLKAVAAGEAGTRDYIIAEPTWVIGPRAVMAHRPALADSCVHDAR